MVVLIEVATTRPEEVVRVPVIVTASANVAARVLLVSVNAVPPVPSESVRSVAAGEVRLAKIGVRRVGEVESTLLPVPVEVVTPVPPLVTARVPVTPVVKGRSVRLVAMPLAGVPSAGVVRIGLVSVRPATVVVADPSVSVVLPRVNVELPRAVLGIAVNVLFAPLMLLLVNVSIPASVDRMPIVGSVILVVPFRVNTRPNAPEVVTLPPSVIVLPVLATPVPPLAPATMPVMPDAGADVAAIVPLPVVVSVLPLPMTREPLISLVPEVFWTLTWACKFAAARKKKKNFFMGRRMRE